jgi:hypothetical protein
MTASDDLTWEYTLAYDGVPRMDGTHQRCQMGTFRSLELAKQALKMAKVRAGREQSLRVERRQVGAWEVIELGVTRKEFEAAKGPGRTDEDGKDVLYRNMAARGCDCTGVQGGCDHG